MDELENYYSKECPLGLEDDYYVVFKTMGMALDKMDDRGVQRLLYNLENDDISKAIAYLDGRAIKKLFRNMVTHVAKSIAEESEAVQPISVEESGQATQKILRTLVNLVEQGEIAYPDDVAVIAVLNNATDAGRQMWLEKVHNTKILDLGSSAEKHYKTKKNLLVAGIEKIDWAADLDSGMQMITEAVQEGNPYNIILTDMYYPLEEGGDSVGAGEKLITYAVENHMNGDVILFSSENTTLKNDNGKMIYGKVHYEKGMKWAEKLMELIAWH